VTTTPDLGLEPAKAPEGPRVPYGRSPSLRPALVVLACAAVVSCAGFAIALVGSGQPAPPTVTGLGSPVPGVNLTAVDAAGVLHRITSAGTPPSDVLSSLVLPNGARIVSTSDDDAGVDAYDRSIYLEVDTSTRELVKFYETELERAHWKLLGSYPNAGAGKELLGQRTGSDGYVWEVGVVMTPVNPAISPSLAGEGQTSPTTGLRIRLFEVSDSGS